MFGLRAIFLLGLTFFSLSVQAMPYRCDADDSDAGCRNAPVDSSCARGSEVGVCAPVQRDGAWMECRCVEERRTDNPLREIRRGIHQVFRDVFLYDPHPHRRPIPVCRHTNIFGKYAEGGGCNTFGCWPPGGSCNAFGCSATSSCGAISCQDKINSFVCSDRNDY